MEKLARFWRAETGIFVGIWLGLMIVGRSRLFQDPGTFWHIAAGERILTNQQLIQSDPFSFTCAGKPWIDQWWLADCFLALIHRIDSLNSILLATVTGLAILYTWVGHRLLNAGMHWIPTVLVLACTIAASSYHFHPRPHLVTIALIGWTFAMLSDFEAGRVSIGQIFWLFPWYVLWSNMHGGVVGGVAMLTVCVAGWSLTRWVGWRSPIVRPLQLVLLGVLVLACSLSALINPYGLELPRVWFYLMRSPMLPHLIIEHAPLQFSELAGCMVLLFGLVYVAALTGVSLQSMRISWLIPLIWLYLTLGRIRYGPIFAITAALAFAEMFPYIRWVAWLTRHGSELLRVQPRASALPEGMYIGPFVVPVFLVLSAILFQTTALAIPVVGHGWSRLDAGYWPVQLLPSIRKFAASQPDGAPIFNDMLFGGFLIYHAPSLRVFIDDRCELYGDAQLLAYDHAFQLEPEQVDRWQLEYNFNSALTIPGSNMDSYLRRSPDWVTAQETAAATLFFRKMASGATTPAITDRSK